MKLKHLAKRFGAVAIVAASVGVLAPIAQATTPATGYEQFAGCPSSAEPPAASACLRSVIASGHFKMGSKNVPITNPITLSGGLEEVTGKFIANSKGGLTPVKQTIPGGVVGITGLDWLINFLNIEQLKLYAVTELVGTPVLGSETFSLPIRVHLINSALGSKCYVGTVASPIQLNMTTGTTSPPGPNKPITGKNPTFSFDGATSILHYKEGTFVDNSFAAPGASGCQLTLFGFIPVDLDGLVNLQAGLPSAAGKNETVQNFELEIAVAPLVYP